MTADGGGAKPGYLPAVGGLVLLLLSAVLAGGAWWGYQRGVPGLPVMPPEYSGAIVVFAPPGLVFDTRVEYTQDRPSDRFASDSVIVQFTVRSSHPAPYVLVAGFQGDTRLTEFVGDHFEIDESVQSRYGSRLFEPLGYNRLGGDGGDPPPGSAVIQYVAHTQKDGSEPGNTPVGVWGAFAYPVFASQNARTVVRTKRFERVVRCPALGDPDFVKSFNRDTWLNTGLATCKRPSFPDTADQNQTTSITLVPAFRNRRLDYATWPGNGKAVLGFDFPGNDFARVDASLTDLDEEARGQSYLFGSGVAVGLATSLLPGSMTIMFAWISRRYRWRK